MEDVVGKGSHHKICSDLNIMQTFIVTQMKLEVLSVLWLSLDGDETRDHCTFFLSHLLTLCNNTLSAMPPRKRSAVIRKMKPGVYLPRIVRPHKVTIWKPSNNGTRYTAATRYRGCGLRFGFSNPLKLVASLARSSLGPSMIVLIGSSTRISRSEISWRKFLYATKRVMMISRRKRLMLTCTLSAIGCDLELSKE